MAWKVRLSRLTVVVLALVFAGMFAFSIRDITGHAALLPRGVIAAIVLVVVWNVIAELRTPVPQAAEEPGTAAKADPVTPAEAGQPSGPADTGDTSGEVAPVATSVWRGLGVVVAAGGLVALAPRIGFYPAAAIFAPAVMAMLGMRSPLRIGLATGVLLGITYVIFTMLLNIRLP